MRYEVTSRRNEYIISWLVVLVLLAAASVLVWWLELGDFGKGIVAIVLFTVSMTILGYSRRPMQ